MIRAQLPGISSLCCRHRGHHQHPHPHADGTSGHTHEVTVARRILDANDQMAAHNRQKFAQNKVFVLNVMSSPGSGKTTTLVNTIQQLKKGGLRCAVIVGDICTRNDADRLAATGVPSVQINTDQFGGDCHLTAEGIDQALATIDLSEIDLLIVENVGNLVCPAEFDIGEDARAVILSVTEGEDKPLKYPLMFRQCDVALLNKTDLLPHLTFDAQLATDNIQQVHPGIPVWPISATSGEGFAPWIAWLTEQIAHKQG